MTWTLALAAATVLAASARAQFFTNYGPADGLLDPAVTCLLKGGDGFLWVGTQQGLYRYDGGRFKAYHYDPADSSGLPHDHVERMTQSPDGRIWITSGNGGLTVYDPSRDRFRTWEQLTGQPDPGVGLPTRAVFCHNEDSIYVGVFGQGLRLYLPRTGETVHIPCMRDGTETTAESIAAWPGHPHELFVMLGNHLFVLDMPTLRARPLEVRTHDRKPGPMLLNGAQAKGPDVLWLGTWGEGLWRCDPRNGECERYLPDPVPPLTLAKNIIGDVLLDTQHGMLVGTNQHLTLFDPASGRFQPMPHDPADPNALPAEGIRDLLIDEAGIVWIGRSGGLSKWDPAQDRFVARRFLNGIERSTSNPRLTGVVERDGVLLVGTSNGDGLLVEQADGTFKAHPHPNLATGGLSAVQINELVRTRSGRVVASVRNLLFEVEQMGGGLRPLPIPPFEATGGMLSHLEDRDGHWWFGFQRSGVIMADPERGTLQRFNEEGAEQRRLSSSVWCQGLVEDREGDIWVNAYEQGIDRISADRQRVEHFRYAEHPWLRTSKVWDIVIDDSNRLWLGTNGRGIVITPASDPGGEGTVQLLGGSSGAPAMVSSLFKDRDGRIWAGGPSGLYRIDPGTFIAKRFDRSEGLRGADFHHAGIRQHPSGRITITPSSGELIIVDPKKLDEPPGPFGISISDVLIHGHAWQSDTALNVLKVIDLAPDQNFIEVGYGAIAFSLRSKIRLAHQLLGIDPAPVITGPSGRAVYTSLPPGTHRLMITDASSGAADPLRVITIRVRPHYWQTWGFKAAAALSIIAVLIAVWRWRAKVFRDKERVRSELQRRLAGMEMQALRAQMNPHFLFNSLNSINRYIMQNEPETASEYLTKFARLMRSVLVHSKEQLVSLKDELEALRLYIELEALRFTHAFSYDAIVELDEDPSRVMIPPMLLQPYVENAIWHGLMHRAAPGGHLSIAVRRRNGALEVVIEDNGVGREAAGAMKSKSAAVQRSMGMRITRERLDLVRGLYDLDADVSITDLSDLHRRPMGTRVTIQISPKST